MARKANRTRSRVTNRPPANRPKRTPHATARRVTDLYTAYLARLGSGPHDPIVEANALRWAELTTICETLRARALAGEDIDANAITRLESTVGRVSRATAAEAARADEGLSGEEFARAQAEGMSELWAKARTEDTTHTNEVTQ
jgi:hypothetical protein